MENTSCPVRDAVQAVGASLLDWSGNVLGVLERRVKKNGKWSWSAVEGGG